MEKEGYGKGKIHVDSVLFDDFNKNPDEWLKLGDKWNYDIIVFGMWDANGDKPLEDKAVNVTEMFIKDGGSCILCHDTIGYIWGNSGLNKLRDYFGLKIGKWGESPYGDYNQQWGYKSFKIKVTKTGKLTSYPWKIGEIETVLNVSETHTCSTAVPKDNVWFELCNGNYWDEKEPDALQKANYSDSFYLSIKDKCAMIQVGHSINCNTHSNNNVVTSDEKKIMANLIFYLYNLKK